jgi:hypothetical protein
MHMARYTGTCVPANIIMRTPLKKGRRIHIGHDLKYVNMNAVYQPPEKK